MKIVFIVPMLFCLNAFASENRALEECRAEAAKEYNEEVKNCTTWKCIGELNVRLSHARGTCEEKFGKDAEE